MQKNITLVIVIMLLFLPFLSVVADQNQCPNTPTINGPTEGKLGQNCIYFISSTDPEGDLIKYEIRCSDDPASIFETDLYPSGMIIEFEHCWCDFYQKTNPFSLRVRAIDTFDHTSEWNTYETNLTNAKGKDKTQTGQAEVYTDKPFYRKYEPIDITFYNKATTSITLGGPPIYRIYRFSFIQFQWTYIYPEWVGLVLYTINAGGSMSDTWDQTDLNGEQVRFGIYKVEVPYSQGFTPQNATDIFFILP